MKQDTRENNVERVEAGRKNCNVDERHTNRRYRGMVRQRTGKKDRGRGTENGT